MSSPAHVKGSIMAQFLNDDIISKKFITRELGGYVFLFLPQMTGEANILESISHYWSKSLKDTFARKCLDDTFKVANGGGWIFPHGYLVVTRETLNWLRNQPLSGNMSTTQSEGFRRQQQWHQQETFRQQQYINQQVHQQQMDMHNQAAAQAMQMHNNMFFGM
jgi:hypothetical protein